MLHPISFTIPIEPDLKNRLDKLSNNINRSAPAIAALAIQEFVDTYEWQSNEILKRAFSEASKLENAQQNSFALWLLEELASEQKWDSAFSNSQDLLSQLADEALIEYQAGKTQLLNPDKL